MQVPNKLKFGDSWRRGTFNKINEIIDYLKTQRLTGDNKSIIVTQNTSGISIKALEKSPSAAKGGSTPFKHPFKLYLSKDENDKQQVCMQQGRLLIQSTDNTAVHYRYQVTQQGDTGSNPQDDYIPINWDNTNDGVYLIMGYLAATYTNNSLGLSYGCIVAGGNIYIQDVPCCQGYLTFYIGTVSKQTLQDESYRLQVINNRITSDLIVNDFMLSKPFNVYAVINHGQANTVKTAISDWTVSGLYCRSGKVYDDMSRTETPVSYNGGYSPSGANAYLYLVFDVETKDVQLQWTATEKDAYIKQGDQLIQRNYLVASYIKTRNVIYLLQNIDNDIILNQSDTFKFIVDNGDIEAEDKVPNYAVNKLYGQYGTLQQDTQQDYYGYIGVYQQANAYSENEDDLALKFKWCYNEIDNYSTTDYIQLNTYADSLLWQPAYRVRVNQDDDSPDYLYNKLQQGDHINLSVAGAKVGIDAEPPTITGVSPIIATVDAGGWNFTISFDDSEFVKTITGTSCITATRSGTAVTLAADLQCIFQNFSITGTSPITVSGSGQSWSIGFDDTGFLKTLTAGTCINVSRNGSTATVGVNKSCIFQNFSITGTSPITVSGSGQSWTIGFNATNLVSAGTCINVSNNNGVAVVSVDKSCVFQNFSITGSSPILVSGSGQSWSIGFDDTGFVKSITSADGTVSCTRNGSTVDLSVPNIGKVKLYQGDTLGYLYDKFANDNGIIEFYLNAGGIDAKLGQNAIESPDQSIEVNITGGGVAQLEVDWSKVVIDQSLAPLISKSVSNHVMTLSLNAPSSGNYVLMAQNGSVGWVAVGACDSSSSSAGE